MRNVRAAYVECPGHVLRIGNQQRVGAQFHEFCPDALDLVGGGFASELYLAHADRCHRRRRAVAPKSINWVAVDCHQLGASCATSSPKSFGLFAGVQPWIVTEPVSAFQFLLEPLLRRTLHQMLNRKNISVDLSVGLKRVAAIDKQRRFFAKHDRRAGRACEASEPGEPLFACGQVLVLLTVGARHYKTCEPASLQLRSQFADALCAVRSFA